MDRLSALDLAFLDLETPQAPLHVGWTLRFEGEPPSLAGLRRHMEARLDAVPRFRRRLVRPALGSAHWVDDVRFDVAHHVFGVALPAPGANAELRDAAGTLLSTPLPLDRPLWRLHLVTGLRSGFALVGQAHHALVDGIAAIEVALLLFGDAPERTGRGWAPVPAPSSTAAALTSAQARTRAAARALRGLSGMSSASRVRDAMRALEVTARPAPATALDVSATRQREVAFADVPLPDVRDVGRRHDATVNDVLLCASALALGATLRRRGECPWSLKALVPVSVREDAPAALGNQISFLAVDLPVAEPDPLRALRAVRARTAAAKREGEAGPLAALARAADALPDAARTPMTRAIARAASFNLVVSNVPGPPVELALLGRPLASVHPMVPLLHGHALTIGAVSYRDRLHVGLAADAEVLPEVADLGRALEAAFDALRVARPPSDPPWRAKARVRRQRLASR